MSSNKFFQAAAGTAAAGGAGNLNVEDVFSTYLYEGNGTFQTIKNDIALGAGGVGNSAEFGPTNSDDTDELSLGSGNYITSGDFTIECFVYVIPAGVNSANNEFPTIFSFNSPRLSLWYRLESGGDRSNQYFRSYDTAYHQGTTDQHPEETYTGAWVHIAMVRSSGTITLYVDGTAAYNWTNTTDYTGADLGIGNDGNSTAFQGYISNFRIVNGTAVYTSNFTPPTEDLTAISGTTLLTCVGSNSLTDSSGNSHSISVTGTVTSEAFGPFDATDSNEGGLVWIKGRTGSVSHALYDTERGRNSLRLSSNSTNSAIDVSGYDFTGFQSNGFTVSARGGALHNFTNDSGRSFSSWTFRKAPKFFDVVTYTGDGTAGRTVSHNLGSVPGCIFVKLTSGSDSWAVYHRGVDSSAPEDYRLVLNGTNARIDNTDGSRWNRTAPTSTEFTVGTDGSVNANGATYVAYLFAHNDGDGEFGPDGDADIIKCGSYSGTGAEQEINLGFEPQWIMVKAITSSGEEWAIFDTMRGLPTDGVAQYLTASNSGGENWGGDVSDFMEVTSTGFRLPNQSYGWVNGSTQDYIYIAIRRGPMAVPEDATDVFAPAVDDDSTPPSWNTSFPVDMMFEAQTAGGTKYIFDRLLGQAYRETTTATIEGTSAAITWDYMNGVGDTADAGWLGWLWRRAPSFFDAVAYTGNGTAGRTVSHNLGVAPEMIWVKARDSARNWSVYHTGLTASTPAYRSALRLNSDSAELTNETYWSDYPDADNFYLDVNGGDNNVNGSGINYIAYLFASLDGVSKVGSYTGNAGASTINVDCGFSSGARFVLIKEVSGTGDWWFFDTVRGLVSGNDAALKLNTVDAESSADYIDPYSGGFSLQTNSGINTNGATFIFYAIA